MVMFLQLTTVDVEGLYAAFTGTNLIVFSRTLTLTASGHYARNQRVTIVFTVCPVPSETARAIGQI